MQLGPSGALSSHLLHLLQRKGAGNEAPLPRVY